MVLRPTEIWFSIVHTSCRRKRPEGGRSGRTFLFSTIVQMNTNAIIIYGGDADGNIWYVEIVSVSVFRTHK